MRIAVICNDAGMAANVGGSVSTTVYTFPMPEEIEKLVRHWTGAYSNAVLAICKDDEVSHDSNT